MKEKYQIGVILTTTANKDDAKELSKILVRKKLAACVQISKIDSIYRWKDEIHDDEEYRLMIKFPLGLKETVIETILAEHKYDTPEITYTEFDSEEDYWKWCIETTTKQIDDNK